MIFSKDESNKIYGYLYDWVSSISAGGSYQKSRLNFYQKKIWDLLLRKKEEITVKDRQLLTREELLFLNNVVYNGPIYRIQHYNSRRKGHIYENMCYQSWSSDVKSLSNVKFSSHDLILLTGETDCGFNTRMLLIHLYKFYYESGIINPMGKNIDELTRYFCENEVASPMNFEFIHSVILIERNQLEKGNIDGIEIPKEKWRRN